MTSEYIKSKGLLELWEVKQGKGRRVDFDRWQKLQFIELPFKQGNNLDKTGSEGWAKRLYYHFCSESKLVLTWSPLKKQGSLWR
jgi:hypothetical protein